MAGQGLCQRHSRSPSAKRSGILAVLPRKIGDAEEIGSLTDERREPETPFRQYGRALSAADEVLNRESVVRSRKIKSEASQ